ncbi:MAG: cytochrome c peroxidase, partial [Polyangiaceae bacterium]
MFDKLEALKIAGAPNKTIQGIEPSGTRDGKILVWHGSPKGGLDLGHIRYALRNDDGTYTMPDAISALYTHGSDVLPNGSLFSDRYPLARYPLALPLGDVISNGGQVRGAYPWLSQDGSLLTIQATGGKVFPKDIRGTQGTRNRLAIVGPPTLSNTSNGLAYQFKVIDTHVNDSIGIDQTAQATISGSVGRFDGAWDPRHTGARSLSDALPVRPEDGLLGLYTTRFHGFYYSEVSFRDQEDQHYLLYSDLIEPYRHDAYQNENIVVFDRAQDTSGHGQRIDLQLAAYPWQLLYQLPDPKQRDIHIGRIGQAVGVGLDSAVRISASPTLHAFDTDALTVELWVKRIVDIGSLDNENRYLYLANSPSFDIILEDNGQLQVSITLEGNTGPVRHRSGFVGNRLGVGVWHHVAMRYAAADGKLVTYLDGKKAGSTDIGSYAIHRNNAADVTFGPAGLNNPAPRLPVTVPALLIDDLRISNVARSEQEVRSAALLRRPEIERADVPIELPLGFDARDLHVPADNPITEDKINLGRHIFFDARLSSDGTIACASCHDPKLGFGDGKPRAEGVTRKPLKRRTPVITNLSFHDGRARFFWDGRAATLEKQVLEPFMNPDEHGFTKIDPVLTIIKQDPLYLSLYANAFDEAPTEANTAKALATFVRTLIAG